jgi:hypothetical protein
MGPCTDKPYLSKDAEGTVDEKQVSEYFAHPKYLPTALSDCGRGGEASPRRLGFDAGTSRTLA